MLGLSPSRHHSGGVARRIRLGLALHPGLAPLLATLLASSVVAQGGVHTVGPTGKATHREINAAVAVAKPGDRVLVLPGTYQGFSCNKGIRILGSKGVRCGPVRVKSLPAGQCFGMRGIEFGYGSFASSLLVEDCKGHVVIEDCVGLATDTDSRFQRAADVRLVRCGFHHGTFVDQSVVEFESCAVLPFALMGMKFWVGISATDSRVTIARSVVSGTTHITSGNGVPAILSWRSDLRIYGASLLVAGGSQTLPVGNVDVLQGSGSVVHSAATRFLPTGNGRAIAGPSVRISIAPLLETSPARIGNLQSLELFHQSNEACVILFGALLVPVPVPAFDGDVALGSEFPLLAGVFSKNSLRFQIPIPNDKKLLGLPIVWQALATAGNSILLSNAATVLVGEF